jgi:hypothetical protein
MAARRQRKDGKKSRKEHRRKKIKKTPPADWDKFESVLYATKAAEIIRGRDKADRRPFFIYLSFLTKSYPRELKVSNSVTRLPPYVILNLYFLSIQFCIETFCRGDVLCGDLYVRRIFF